MLGVGGHRNLRESDTRRQLRGQHHPRRRRVKIAAHETPEASRDGRDVQDEVLQGYRLRPPVLRLRQLRSRADVLLPSVQRGHQKAAAPRSGVSVPAHGTGEAPRSGPPAPVSVERRVVGGDASRSARNHIEGRLRFQERVRTRPRRVPPQRGDGLSPMRTTNSVDSDALVMSAGGQKHSVPRGRQQLGRLELRGHRKAHCSDELRVGELPVAGQP
jgi:hypothetical protein